MAAVKDERRQADFDTPISVSGQNCPWGAIEVSFREKVMWESGKRNEVLCGDGYFHEVAGAGGGSTTIPGPFGDYTLFVDESGSLMIRTPDDTIVPLVLKT